MKCAKEELISVVEIYRNDNHQRVKDQNDCGNVRLMDWTWLNISN